MDIHRVNLMFLVIFTYNFIQKILQPFGLSPRLRLHKLFLHFEVYFIELEKERPKLTLTVQDTISP